MFLTESLYVLNIIYVLDVKNVVHALRFCLFAYVVLSY